MSPRDPQIPPLGEEIHIPRPSLIPVGVAVGVTVALIGLTLTPILIAAGLLLALPLIWRWIRDTRQDIDELPLDHH